MPRSNGGEAAVVSDRLLVDHGPDGRLSLTAWLDGELTPGAASSPSTCRGEPDVDE